MSLGTTALGDVEKAAAAAVEGKAGKGAGRSYMGQLHSSIANAGENLGMSKKAASVASGIGMAGAGIGAFSIANNTSENHPFLGGAAKIGIIAGAGYAALKGHGAKAIGEGVEEAAFKKIDAAMKELNGGILPPRYNPTTAVTEAAEHVENNATHGAAAVTPPAGAAADSTAGGAVNTHGAVPVTTPPPTTAPPAAGVVNANGSLHNTVPAPQSTAGTTPVVGTLGTSQGAGAVLVSGAASPHPSLMSEDHQRLILDNFYARCSAAGKPIK